MMYADIVNTLILAGFVALFWKLCDLYRRALRRMQIVKQFSRNNKLDESKHLFGWINIHKFPRSGNHYPLITKLGKASYEES